jgi:hypothetical protein
MAPIQASLVKRGRTGFMRKEYAVSGGKGQQVLLSNRKTSASVAPPKEAVQMLDGESQSFNTPGQGRSSATFKFFVVSATEIRIFSS